MIPEGMPTLSAGAHEPGDGKACVMEYVALLAGESWTDSPACTHRVLARMAQAVNDRLPDERRHELVPLIGRLFGTAETGTDHERKVLSVRLACWSARQVLHLARDRGAAERAIEAAEAWTRGEATDAECRSAADAAYAYAAAAGDAAAAAAYASAADATYASAHAASVAAGAADAASAADLVGLLTGLLDEYDRLTGRVTHRKVTDADLAHLAAAV